MENLNIPLKYINGFIAAQGISNQYSAENVRRRCVRHRRDSTCQWVRAPRAGTLRRRPRPRPLSQPSPLGCA